MKRKSKKSFNGLAGAPLAYPAKAQAKYEARLAKLVSRMTKEVEREIERLYKTPEGKAYFAQDASVASQARILMNSLTKKFNDMFGRAAGIMSIDMVGEVNKASGIAVAGSVKTMGEGLTVNSKIMSADLHETVKASIAQNAGLIKSIPQEYLAKVSGTVLRSVTSGQGLADILPVVKEYGGQTDRRAKNLALDQTRKAFNSINADRMRKVGVQKFKWIHSGGGLHPRRDHQEMDGMIFSLDNPPVIDPRTGERGLPGQAVNCRCTMVPVIEFDDAEEESL